MRLAFASSIALALLATTATAGASPALRVDGRFFRDAQGGVVVLRGVDATADAKVPPFRPLRDPSLLDPLAGWGMNAVRLLFSWEAYEPSPGRYDESYLDYYASVVDAAGQRGLYVVVDFHQDAFSRASIGGCGEGFPMWAVPWWAPHATPDNGPACENWPLRALLDPFQHLSWGAFYRDDGGARTRYLAMVERVAQRLATHPAAVGYDMINEPLGKGEEIEGLYEDAAVAIRRADPTAILFVSPHAITGGGTVPVDLPRPRFGNFAFAPHFYFSTMVYQDAWNGEDLGEAFGNLRAVAETWGVPLFIGEFGARGTTRNGNAYVRAVYDQLDASLASGTQWAYTPAWTPAHKDGYNGEDLSIVDHTGAPRSNFAPRAYPRRVAGTPTHFAMATAADGSASVQLSWDNDPRAGATEVYVPAPASRAPTALVADDGLACAVGAEVVRCSSRASGPVQLTLTLAPE